MAHLLTPSPTAAATALSTRPRKNFLHSCKNECSPTPRVCCVGHQYQHYVPDQDQLSASHNNHSMGRRVLVGLSGALLLGLSWGTEQSASAAARRPPPPPPEEKKDPNVSGVQAKVLASKRRKEAMKETMAKLREKGKPINKEPPPPSPPAPE